MFSNILHYLLFNYLFLLQICFLNCISSFLKHIQQLWISKRKVYLGNFYLLAWIFKSIKARFCWAYWISIRWCFEWRRFEFHFVSFFSWNLPIYLFENFLETMSQIFIKCMNRGNLFTILSLKLTLYLQVFIFKEVFVKLRIDMIYDCEIWDSCCALIVILEF